MAAELVRAEPARAERVFADLFSVAVDPAGSAPCVGS
jgi:hypothetical protein